MKTMEMLLPPESPIMLDLSGSNADNFGAPGAHLKQCARSIKEPVYIAAGEHDVGCTFEACTPLCTVVTALSEMISYENETAAERALCAVSAGDSSSKELCPVGDPEEGASTAEYGVVMLAAVGFAGLLALILKSDEVKNLLLNIVRTALGGATPFV
ncbi:MAG: DUF4244 domain-containing protein [Rothia sp. (in: high G+C Gram-positive bacteria)]|uniref:DUF4244 domain-containing protein n=1 Tax=Rothia sp. (in: high G+C Gram-positive bacteria) TaxID=1885016 RepID=UPI0026DF0F3E|nr:DUF4244 domain-containing protein [Rothia sp. (in: high G+C Gram-positive bacteria)]MDO5749884.1 DUF4244 domain-containing protein [Rothia sp. (in: high G+C Gram-positive bacteria)]